MTRLLRILVMNLWHSVWRKQSAFAGIAVCGSILSLLLAQGAQAAPTPLEKTVPASTFMPRIAMAGQNPHGLHALHAVPLVLVGDSSAPVGSGPGKNLNAVAGSSSTFDDLQLHKSTKTGSTVATDTQDKGSLPGNRQNAQTFSVDSIDIDNSVQACLAHQSVYEVSSGRLMLARPSDADSILTWAWEVRIDTGSNDTSNPPLPTTATSQNISAGTALYTFSNTDSTQPLVDAPEMDNYSYSFRLHVTSPVDVASQWISVPQQADPGC